MTRAHSVPIGRSDLVPPELLGVVPRDVRLTPAGTAVAAVAVAMAVGALASAIVMSAAYMRGEAQAQMRAREGVTVQAEVVQVAVRHGEHPRRIVTYRFAAHSRTYDGRTTLRERDRRSITEGLSIPVTFVSSQPETNWMTGYEPQGFPLWPIPLVSLALLAVATAIAWSLRRQWVLLSEGRVAQARITAQKRVHSDKRKAYRVNSEFQDLSGATHLARYEVGKAPPAIGATVPIIYHRDNPKWNALYPLELVRANRVQRADRASGLSGS